SGLFGSLGFGGVVSNLGLKSAAISGQNTGGIAGHNYGSISGCFVADSNCFVADSIFGSYVGGIAGQNDGSISNSFVADSSVSGSTVGGIAGHSGLSISNCFVIDSEISGTMAGGIAGQNGSYIDNCFVAGDGFVAGPEAGGIVGRNYYGDISKCYVAVSVTGADYGNYTPQYIGGIVGTLSTEGTVSNCVMLGAEVYGTDAIVNRIGTSSILQNNYAWEGTKVNEADVLNGNHRNENGANATINNLEDKDWWAGVGFDFDNDRIWTFNDDGPPTLTWYSEP
ncbi:MAG: hypothetical protein FWH06_00730, partial [Oscillospiraceae bacterium]|nr:hypothetical protein [Oscillospiraceae bacterium]